MSERGGGGLGGGWGGGCSVGGLAAVLPPPPGSSCSNILSATTRSCRISVSWDSIRQNLVLNRVRWANRQLRWACRFSRTTSLKWQWYRCANTWNKSLRILRTIDSNELGNSCARKRKYQFYRHNYTKWGDNYSTG